VKKPKIRFKGFTETWEQRKLETYLQEYNEVTSTNNQYPALTSSRKGLFLQTDYFSGNQVASENNIGYNVVPYGYFTYRHMSDDEVFHFNLNDIVDKGIVSTLYPVFTTSKELDSKYLQYQLNYGEEFSRFARLQKQGGSRTYMYLNKLRKLSLTMPNTLDEQKEISAILSTLDHFITLHQRKCENLKKLKKFMLQKLFPQNGENVPKVRFLNFTDTWEQRKLGNIMEVASVKRIHRKDWTDSGVRFLRARDIVSHFKNEKQNDCLYISKEKYDECSALSGKVSVGDLLVTGVGTIGIPYLVNDLNPIYFKDGNIIWFKNGSKINGFFLYYSFIGNEIQNFINVLSGTGTVGTYTIESGKKTSISLPDKLEQQKIGNFLKHLDHLITLHQSKCDKLKEVKKYMLQNMFI
jgi:type I restriction enzyme S subunit